MVHSLLLLVVCDTILNFCLLFYFVLNFLNLLTGHMFGGTFAYVTKVRNYLPIVIPLDVMVSKMVIRFVSSSIKKIHVFALASCYVYKQLCT